jgi:hypothetical protein
LCILRQVVLDTPGEVTAMERYSVHYRMSGPVLDVDALLAVARPAGVHEVWRRGDALDEGHHARTSGVQVEIVDADDPAAVVEAIDAFLDAEVDFLSAVGRFASDETLSVVACALWVYEDEPTGLLLPPELLARLAEAGIGVDVSGYPREETGD